MNQLIGCCGLDCETCSEREILLIYRRFRIETRKEHGRKVKYRKAITAQIQKHRNTYISIIKGKKERSKYGY